MLSNFKEPGAGAVSAMAAMMHLEQKVQVVAGENGLRH